MAEPGLTQGQAVPKAQSHVLQFVLETPSETRNGKWGTQQEGPLTAGWKEE